MMSKQIELKVNGKVISLNRFVKDVFQNVIFGLLDTLDNIPEKKEKITITIEEEKK